MNCRNIALEPSDFAWIILYIHIHYTSTDLFIPCFSPTPSFLFLFYYPSSLFASYTPTPIQVHQLVLYDNMVSGTIMDRIRETLHSDMSAREHVAARDRALMHGALTRSSSSSQSRDEANEKKAAAAAEAKAALYDVLDGYLW
jgi:hypothetical protein